ncbi:MAG: signal peptidase II [Alphaproteobacteria bacterium]
MKSRRSLIAYALALLVVAMDQASKYWVLEVFHLPEKNHVEVTPFFDLTDISNTGVSFGLFRADDGQEWIRWILAAFSVIVVVILAIWVRGARRTWSAVSIGLIMGGAVGNLIDRVRFGHVTDFLDFSKLHFPWVFNVADAAINVGIAILLIETFLLPDRRKAAAV